MIVVYGSSWNNKINGKIKVDLLNQKLLKLK